MMRTLPCAPGGLAGARGCGSVERRPWKTRASAEGSAPATRCGRRNDGVARARGGRAGLDARGSTRPWLAHRACGATGWVGVCGWWRNRAGAATWMKRAGGCDVPGRCNGARRARTAGQRRDADDGGMAVVDRPPADATGLCMAAVLGTRVGARRAAERTRREGRAPLGSTRVVEPDARRIWRALAGRATRVGELRGPTWAARGPEVRARWAGSVSWERGTHENLDRPEVGRARQRIESSGG